MRIGLHTSIAKSLESAALRAAELGANTFQIFSGEPTTVEGFVSKRRVDRVAESRAR